jgi:hypothetical protein
MGQASKNSVANVAAIAEGKTREGRGVILLVSLGIWGPNPGYLQSPS